MNPAEKYEELVVSDLDQILSLTIKGDIVSKTIVFLCFLSAYTEDSQLNISLNAPSSHGKSYLALETCKLFPKDDVLELGYVSPKAFYHDCSRFDKETKIYHVNLENKILIFTDQPHQEVLQRLRPLFSHDKKEINVKVTDKGVKHGLETKNIIIRGYPSVAFCTANLLIDEQEATRFFLLSPEDSQEKIKQGIQVVVQKESNNKQFREALAADPRRNLLIDRIKDIKISGIKEINIDLTPLIGPMSS